MDKKATDDLIFFVNGKKVIESSPEPETSLLQYLRRSLLLPGTKEGCGHGGCGSCTVMVSKYEHGEKRIRHYTVNACLFPLCAAHGLAITTVEGVGNPRTGLHDVQKRLIESHGLQCGFCTPGFVMSVFTLLRNNPTPTRNELEKAIEGNLCRCTGYRPIVQAFNSLCQDACPQGELCCKNQKQMKEQEHRPTVEDRLNQDAVTSQVAIFPAELQLSDQFSCTMVTFRGSKWTGIRPTSLEDLLTLKDRYPDAPIIMGNTIAGLNLKLGRIKGNTLIYGGDIATLKMVGVTENGIELGAGLTINELEEKLKEIEPRVEQSKRCHFQALYHMIEKYGADQIRNAATIGGSLMSGRSNSDIITILAGLSAFVNIKSVTSERSEKVDNIVLGGKEVIKSVHVPFSGKNEYAMFHKQSDRRTFSLAILNSCMFVRLSDEGTLQCLRMTFGGIGKQVIVIEKAPKSGGSVICWLRNKQWDCELLQNVLTGLPELLKKDDIPSVDEYKLNVASGFFHKFYGYIKQNLSEKPSSSKTSEKQETLSMEPCCWTSLYEPFTDPDQSPTDALHRPVPNVSSEAIVSGEAVYIDDMPASKGELFLALVTSKRAHAKILKVDPSAALSVPGVHGFIDHNDIHGQNSWGGLVPDEELLASNEVVCYGQPIGAIVAESREIARSAIWLVKVEYEDLKPILTVEEAIKESSFFDARSEQTFGNIDKGFKESETIIEGEFASGHQEHFYLEPMACLVVPRVENEEMDIYVGSQNLMSAQEHVSKFLGVPRHKISLYVKRIGGSFGGRESRPIMILGPTAIAAHKYKRPVRCILSREVDMEITGKRHPYLTKYKVGVMKTGKIKSLDLKVYINGGISLDYAPFIANKTRSDFNGGYKIDNLNYNAVICKTNVPSNTAFRAFGSPEGLIFMENIIFNIACKLNIPQETVREANFFNKGDITKFGIPLVNCTVRELWERCKQQSNFTSRAEDIAEYNRTNRWQKRGIVMTAERFTIGFDPKFAYQATAVVSIYLDGTVLLTHGGIEMGQGINTKMIQIHCTTEKERGSCLQWSSAFFGQNLRDSAISDCTVILEEVRDCSSGVEPLYEIASRELGIPTDLIYTSDSNTKAAPNSIFTAGSMGTDTYGPAVMDACRIMSNRLKPLREANPEASWNELINLAFFNRVQLTATGFQRYDKQEYDPITKTGTKADYYTYGAICTEVEIDVLTGENQVLQADMIMDVGKSLNPAIDIGQIEGGFVQGLGMVTSEYIDVDENGKMINCSPLSYKIPNVRSIPRKFNVTLVREDTVPTQVYSAKGIGEPPLLLSISVILAIKEAIKAARAEIGLTGYFRLDSPATVQRIRMACGDQLKTTNEGH